MRWPKHACATRNAKRSLMPSQDQISVEREEFEDAGRTPCRRKWRHLKMNGPCDTRARAHEHQWRRTDGMWQVQSHDCVQLMQVRSTLACMCRTGLQSRSRVAAGGKAICLFEPKLVAILRARSPAHQTALRSPPLMARRRSHAYFSQRSPFLCMPDLGPPGHPAD
jgi:hypothetical protein